MRAWGARDRSSILRTPTKMERPKTSKIGLDLIAPCGMDCGVCRAYLRDKNPCKGCNFEHGLRKSIESCKMRRCTKRSGKFCCSCEDFPCKRLVDLDKRYRTKYGMSEIANLEFIKEKGIREFVKKEQKRWVSSKGTFCVHDRKFY